jgi:hypothetical protein
VNEPSVRITTGETVTVGGVPVTVEVDDGELVIRVGRCDSSAEGAPALSYWLGRLHGNVTDGWRARIPAAPSRSGSTCTRRRTEMTPEQKALFHAAVTDAITAKGTPAEDNPGRYGWIAGDYAELRIHMAGCRPAYEACTWEDATWSEFVSTFDPDERCTGLDAVVSCKCGTVQGRTWRYTGGYAELIREITGG